MAPASVLPSPVAISITSPASIRSAPSNCTSNGRSPVARSAASRAIARNWGMSAESARSSRLSRPAALRSFSSLRSAASLSYSSESVTTVIERLRFFSVVAPSRRQKRLLSRPGWERVVFGTAQRYANCGQVQSGQVRTARVGDARVGQDVDDGRQPAGEGTFERRPKLRGRRHQFAVGTQGARHLVVAGARTQLGHH